MIEYSPKTLASEGKGTTYHLGNRSKRNSGRPAQSQEQRRLQLSVQSKLSKSIQWFGVPLLRFVLR